MVPVLDQVMMVQFSEGETGDGGTMEHESSGYL